MSGDCGGWGGLSADGMIKVKNMKRYWLLRIDSIYIGQKWTSAATSNIMQIHSPSIYIDSSSLIIKFKKVKPAFINHDLPIGRLLESFIYKVRSSVVKFYFDLVFLKSLLFYESVCV